MVVTAEKEEVWYGGSLVGTSKKHEYLLSLCCSDILL